MHLQVHLTCTQSRMIVGLGLTQFRINVLDTLSQMLIDRGYNIKGFIKGNKIKRCSDRESFSIENIQHRMKTHPPPKPTEYVLAIEAEFARDPESLKPVHVSGLEDTKIVVFLSDEDSKLGKGQMLEMIEYCNTHGIKRMILPLCVGYTPYAYKEMETSRMNETMFIELFSYDELQKQVIRNELVPAYQLLNKQQVEQLLKKYACDNVYGLPRIGDADVVSRYYGFKKGDVVEEKTTIGGCQTPTAYFVIIRG